MLGDGSADRDFDDFARAAWTRLCRLGYLVCGDEHLAQDLTQTALARTYAAWRRVRHEDAFRYTRRIVINAGIDRTRARARRPELLGMDVEPVQPDDKNQLGPAAQVEDRDELTRLLSHLTVRERQVLALRYYADLTEAETAAEIGVSVGTVKSTASRALAKLRDVRAVAVPRPTKDSTRRNS